ncbi:galactosyltransferase-related protein [Rhizobium laguerreae]|uniref:galactosyltransferase-related protein n=1 Tax=Rhizobium laguerreae TaxID=1076926 RepID=UPI001C90B303|nr:galactosyltransferase-related protein [Rhizobium laguerreae]MBY3222199.1 glycosyl transferase family 2 [Rhizobium laguerreae]
MISVSVVIPWCDRPELLRTLANNSQAFLTSGVEVIIANCGGRQRIPADALLSETGLSVRWLDISASIFNKGLALNLGASLSERDALLFLDADVVIASPVEELIEALNPASFVTIASVVESSVSPRPTTTTQFVETVTHTVEFRTTAGEIHKVMTNRLDLGKRARSGPGLILVWRADFLNVGGMNRELIGWGWDDLDLVARLQIALGRVRREVGSVIHLSHNDDVRHLPRGSRGESEGYNFMTCLAAYAVGDLHGTYETDVAHHASRLRVRTNRNCP